MNKLNTLKSIIHQIISQNELVLKTLCKCLQEKGIRCLDIQIVPHCGHHANAYDMSILLSVLDIVEYYNLANRMNCYYDLTQFFQAMDLHFKCPTYRDNIHIFTYRSEESMIISKLGESDLMNSESLTTQDKLTMYALSFSLFHEIGHLKYDPEILETNQFAREQNADKFAFQAVMSIIPKSQDQLNNAVFIGALIAIGQMLLSRSQDEEIEDIEHPHSIERMYELFRFWNIPYDSPYWEIAFCIIKDWVEKYHQDLTWIKESSLTFKDKVNDAYEHFRKK